MADYRPLVAASGRRKELAASDGLLLAGRVTGDYSNTLWYNRPYVQSNVTDGKTVFTIVPNGNGNEAAWEVTNSASGVGVASRFTTDTQGASFNQTKIGGGAYVPWRFGFNGSYSLAIFDTGRVFVGASPTDDGVSTLAVNGKLKVLYYGLETPYITGDMSAITAAFTRANIYQTNTTNGNTYLTVIPNGTAVGAAVDLITASSGVDYNIVRFGVGATSVRFNQVPQGAATVKPWEWALNAVPYMTMFTSGRVFLGTSATDDTVNQLQVSGTATVTAPADGATTAQVVTADWINRNMAAAIAAAYPTMGGL